MAFREDLVASAVTFLQDPNVSASPIENQIAFLKSKNLTQQEIDSALARASGDTAPVSNYNYGPQQQAARQTPATYGGYQQHQWQQQSPPPELPKRDWRDWFIMATVMGGVSYGLYVVTKRYIVPLIAPPTPPQLEQDKQAIDESFEKAFALLDQLAKDTEALKASEQARTERLDSALAEVESVIGELKASSRRREDESRRVGDEVRGLKDLIPKAMQGQKESTDARLLELNSELKSLKKLMGQRMNPTPSPTTNTIPISRISGTNTVIGSPQVGPSGSSSTPASETAALNEGTASKPASSSTAAGTEAVASLLGRAGSPFGAGVPSGRAAIPAWQMAAANKSTTPTTEAAPMSQEASGST